MLDNFEMLFIVGEAAGFLQIIQTKMQRFALF